MPPCCNPSAPHIGIRGESLKDVNVGICGLGTVGGGTFNVLKRNAEEISRRAGRQIEVVQVASRTINPDCDTSTTEVVDDVFAIVDNPEIEIVVELIGGETLAKEIV